MNTEARRLASRNYHAKREQAGLRKVTVWLSPEARFKLDAFKAAAGSKDKAAELAIMAWRGPSGDDPLAPKATPAVQVGPSTPKPGSRLKVRK